MTFLPPGPDRRSGPSNRSTEDRRVVADGSAVEHNRRAWDALVRGGNRFARPAAEADFIDVLGTVDSVGWLGGDIHGWRTLCLAAGGGKHGPLYATAGAVVTVVDLSGAMLELDRRVAAERGLALRLVQASMDRMPMLESGSFDLVIQPVSTCYVPDVAPVFAEVARVLKPGGLYISQHKNPVSLQADTRPSGEGRSPAYAIRAEYHRTQPLTPVIGSLHREEGTVEFLHTLAALLGGMGRAGLTIEDLTEPFHADPQAAVGTWGHRSRFVSPYLRIKARRTGEPATTASSRLVLTDR